MSKRGRFLYQDKDGVVCISFEHGQAGLPIDTLLPESMQGWDFNEVVSSKKFLNYFDLADLVLAAPKDWAHFCQTVDVKGATKNNPIKVHPPAPNLDFLKLREGRGMDAKRAKDLFTIVTAYWHSKNDLGLEPTLVATLWHSGMTAKDIIDYIGKFTNAEGKLDFGGYKDERGFQILNAVIQSYKSIKGLPDDSVLQQTEVRTLMSIWLNTTRAAKPDTLDMQNSVLHWSDYRQLGIVDVNGLAQINNICELAKRIFSTETPPSFSELSTWANTNLKPMSSETMGSSKAVTAMLKKKRRQGKLNRKRRRR